MTQESFGEWLRSKITQSGLSVQEFAQRASLSKPLVYFYLRGKRLPTPESAHKIAAALNESPEAVVHFARKGMGRPPEDSSTEPSDAGEV